jgi:hypothetical protein
MILKPTPFKTVAAIGLAWGLLAWPARAETFDQYVAACKEQLGFDSIPRFSCLDQQFRFANDTEYLGLSFSESDDFVAHRRVTNNVAAVFACRWAGRNGESNRAVGGEMIVHNRRTGGTCFFELKDTFENAAYPQVPLNPVSPTSSGASATWGTSTGCTRCHSAGPYIASPQIVGALAKFGVLNDGHDTFNRVYHAVGATGSTIAPVLNAQLSRVAMPSCARACHTMRGSPVIDSQVGAGLVFGAVVMPSIHHVIEDIRQNGHMPPGPFSDYRWLNRDEPSGSADSENLAEFERDRSSGKQDLSALYCSSPRYSQARRIGSDALHSSSFFATVRKFNLHDGLVCNSADFPANDPFKCLDFQTRYLCNGSWTAWRGHAPTSAGDDESRTRYKNSWGLCDNPTDIQARRTQPVAGAPFGDPFYGPRDRFRQFNAQGLVCKHEDQPGGKTCSDYAVRFICN